MGRWVGKLRKPMLIQVSLSHENLEFFAPGGIINSNNFFAIQCLYIKRLILKTTDTGIQGKM